MRLSVSAVALPCPQSVSVSIARIEKPSRCSPPLQAYCHSAENRRPRELRSLGNLEMIMKNMAKQSSNGRKSGRPETIPAFFLCAQLSVTPAARSGTPARIYILLRLDDAWRADLQTEGVRYPSPSDSLWFTSAFSTVLTTVKRVRNALFYGGVYTTTFMLSQADKDSRV